jgi:threonine synthase
MADVTFFVCASCAKPFPLDTRDWRCSCGGLLNLPLADLGTEWLDKSRPGLWRYHKALPLSESWAPVTLGEGNTPLVTFAWQRHEIYAKIESQSPTGSFKDRGASVLVTALRGLGVQRVVEDSSGNAGASLAAYAARAGIGCEVFVPADITGPKLAQMAAYGAEVVQIKGKREYAALAAWAAAAHGAFYASHVFSPYFLAGTSTLAYELWEQLGFRAPDAIVLPVGNGTLLLGAYSGFQNLAQSGLISRLPRMFAVQSVASAPIFRAFMEDRYTVEPTAQLPTVATGIAIGQPARGTQVLAAVRATNGAVFAVAEEEIIQSRDQLAHRGFYVEETAAAAMAALPALFERLPESKGWTIVVPLTGHGLKRNWVS